MPKTPTCAHLEDRELEMMSFLPKSELDDGNKDFQHFGNYEHCFGGREHIPPFITKYLFLMALTDIKDIFNQVQS